MADLAATRIVAWLNRARQGAAGFAAPGKAFVPLRPGDIAVLVNNGKEAGKMRDALARRSVRSVYLSDRDSVFGSPQAVETLRWLRACAEPDDDRLLRAALSTATLDLDFAALAALGRDEDAWERRVVQFKAYRDIWQRQGVLPMLRRILLDFGCTRRLLENHVDLAGTGGERILTDLLHLAELLQQASRSLPGEHALIRWLAEQLAAPDGNDDERRMRLESDADLVQVITIHKAKGLEYPLVFLPFICATRVLGPKDVPLKWHDAAGELQLALEADPAVLARADHERLGEDIRKTYVAMTRARHATWIGLAPLAKEPGPGAIGHLFDLAGVEPADFAEAAARFAGGCADIAVEIAPEPTDERYTPARSTAQAGHARRPARTAADNWEISSYSALRTAGDDVPVAVATLPDDTPQSENLREALGELPPAPLAAMPPAEPIHRFPKGAEAGTFLHELLEAAAGFGFAAVQADPLPLRETIARRCAVRGWEAWIDPLAGWMAALLGTPLPIPLDGLVSGQPASFRLQDLNSCKVEMEFWFAAHTVALERLDAAVTRHTLGGRRRPALRPATLNGMLKGFMDLVFERGGRYYVADYKSNWLGSSSSDYTRERMDEAILAHRYDLQYAIYLFALHRLLRSRVPDYDYDRHVGGAAYLFLRGIHAPSAGLHFERPPPILMDELDEIFRGTPGGTA
jgi:exodeoxyribonuclease V beta subunit